MANVQGTSGNDFVHVVGDGKIKPLGYTDIAAATAGDDTINSGGGGNDIIFAGAGNDTIHFASDLTGSDQIDGGDGVDTLVISDQVDITFGPTTLTSIEKILLPFVPLPAGTLGSQHLVMNISNLGVYNLDVDASGLSANMPLFFDGSAVTQGLLTIVGGQGNDVLTGGTDADTFDLSQGGDDTVTGGMAKDATIRNRYEFGDAFTASDQVIGSGQDVLTLSGSSYATGLTPNDHSLGGISFLRLLDGFTYALTTADGNVSKDATMMVVGDLATRVIFNGSAETDGAFNFQDSPGDDIFTGGSGNDSFHLFNEGADSVYGGNGNDSFYGVGQDDTVDGGAGYDTVELAPPQNQFSLHFTDASLLHVEKLVIVSTSQSYQYVTLADGNVAAGKKLTVVGSHEHFYGEAESDGHFHFIQDSGTGDWGGGQKSDVLDLGDGASAWFRAAGGNDVLNGGAYFDFVNTRFDGGAGTDTLSLMGDYSAGFEFRSTTMTDVERLVLGKRFDYALASDDSNLASAQVLTVDASALAASNSARFDGSAETDGKFVFHGGSGDDNFIGGARADRFSGGRGQDSFTGGLGADRFIFTKINESTTAAPDTITDFSRADHDRINLSAIDADNSSKADDAFTFIGSNAFSQVAGELRYVANRVHTLVRGDIDGDGMADFAIVLDHRINLHAGDFIL